MKILLDILLDKGMVYHTCNLDYRHYWDILQYKLDTGNSEATFQLYIYLRNHRRKKVLDKDLEVFDIVWEQEVPQLGMEAEIGETC